MAGGLSTPAGSGDWQAVAEPVLWSASHQQTPHKIESRYSGSMGEVQLFVVLFPQQRQGGEAINQDNGIASEPELSRLTKLSGRQVRLSSQQVTVNRAKVIVSAKGRRHEHLVWQWYRIAGRNLTNRYEGKAWEALARIYPRRADGAWIAITTPLDTGDIESAENRLALFAETMAPQIGSAIDTTLSQTH
jgi:EpsI family protein